MECDLVLSNSGKRSCHRLPCWSGGLERILNLELRQALAQQTLARLSPAGFLIVACIRYYRIPLFDAVMHTERRWGPMGFVIGRTESAFSVPCAGRHGELYPIAIPRHV